MSRLLLVAVAVCAFAAGALSMREYRAWREHREPLGKLAHVGMVVPDLDQAIKTWQAMGFRDVRRVAESRTTATYRGQQIEVTLKRAFIGDELNPQIELMQPVTDLANPWGSELHGSGALIHHIAYWPRDANDAAHRVQQGGFVPIAGNAATRAAGEASWTYLQAPGNALIIELLGHGANAP